MAAASLPGIEAIRKIAAGELPPPPIAELLDFEITLVEPGPRDLRRHARRVDVQPDRLRPRRRRRDAAGLLAGLRDPHDAGRGRSATRRRTCRSATCAAMSADTGRVLADSARRPRGPQARDRRGPAVRRGRRQAVRARDDLLPDSLRTVSRRAGNEGQCLTNNSRTGRVADRGLADRRAGVRRGVRPPLAGDPPLVREPAPARRGRTSRPRRSGSRSTSARASTRATPTPARGCTASPPTCCGTTSAGRPPRRAARRARGRLHRGRARPRRGPRARARARRRAAHASRAADRDALLLHAWADLTYTEIAHATGVPVGTVRSRIHRARTQLRAHLDRTHDERA